jgi:hypothetical protein
LEVETEQKIDYRTSIQNLLFDNLECVKEKNQLCQRLLNFWIIYSKGKKLKIEYFQRDWEESCCSWNEKLKI